MEKFITFLKPKIPIGIAIFALVILMAYSSGSPMGKTGSPGDNNINCSQCHNGPPQNVTGWISTNIPSAGYIPEATYTINISATQTGAIRAGFQFCAEDNLNQKRGELILTNTTETKLMGADHVTHTSDGVNCSSGQRSWSFDWKAPATGTGEITFYTSYFLSAGGQYNGMTYLSNTSFLEAATGINGNSDETSEISLWFDSNSHLLHFKFPDNNSESQAVSFFNISGQKLGEIKFSKNISSDHHQELPFNYQGILIISIESGSFRSVKKMIIL